MARAARDPRQMFVFLIFFRYCCWLLLVFTGFGCFLGANQKGFPLAFGGWKATLF